MEWVWASETLEVGPLQELTVMVLEVSIPNIMDHTSNLFFNK